MFQLSIRFIKENKKLVTICVVIFVGLLFKICLMPNQGRPPMLKVVETEIVKKGNIEKTLSFIGTVKPKKYSVLIAKANGTIDELLPAGSHLKKNEVLARIENPDIEKTHELCVSAEKIAQSQYDRINVLAKSGASSKGGLEDKEKSLIDAKKALSAAKIELENIIIKAPFDGVLGVYKVKDGEQISIGNQIASFYNPNDILIDFDIPGEYINNVIDGQTVYVNNKTYKLTHAQKAIDEDKHMCPAYLEINNKDNFIIGSSIDIDLVIEKKENVLVAPYSSIFIRGGKNFVYVVKEGKAIMKEVVTGLRNKGQIEIAKGISEKDEIITIGQDRLVDGISVKVAKGKQE